MSEHVKHKSTGEVVEARKLTEDNVDAISNWTQSQIVEERDSLSGEVSEAINVKTDLGRERLSQGMYVVKHLDHFKVLTPYNFHALYNPIHDIPESPKRVKTNDPFAEIGRIGKPKGCHGC